MLRTEPVTLTFNLFELKKRLEMERRREFSWTEMATAAGLHHNTLSRMAYGETNRVDLMTLEKIINYFRAEGMSIGVEDLIAAAPKQAE